MRRISLIAVAVLIAATTAYGQRMHIARSAGPAAAVLPAVDLTPCLFVLNLSEGQRMQIKQIVDSEQPAITAITDRLKSDHEALDALAGSAAPDACSVGSAYLKVSADNRALESEFRTIRTKVETALTPDQKAKLDGCLSILGTIRKP